MQLLLGCGNDYGYHSTLTPTTKVMLKSLAKLLKSNLVHGDRVPDKIGNWPRENNGEDIEMVTPEEFVENWA